MSLASRGARKFGDEEEQIKDQAELLQVRRQAQRVIIKALFVALAMTLLGYFLPF
ncbi:MAG TPA: hypothetical protein VK909_18100 [Anaerolineales bacterium]|nr:hypothetical protein [Anaerolineales bacterium]